MIKGTLPITAGCTPPMQPLPTNCKVLLFVETDGSCPPLRKLWPLETLGTGTGALCWVAHGTQAQKANLSRCSLPILGYTTVDLRTATKPIRRVELVDGGESGTASQSPNVMPPRELELGFELEPTSPADAAPTLQECAVGLTPSEPVPKRSRLAPPPPPSPIKTQWPTRQLYATLSALRADLVSGNLVEPDMGLPLCQPGDVSRLGLAMLGRPTFHTLYRTFAMLFADRVAATEFCCAQVRVTHTLGDADLEAIEGQLNHAWQVVHTEALRRRAIR